MEDAVAAMQSTEWLIPPWCLMVVVQWNDKETQAICRASVDYDYRRYNLTFGPQWLSLDEIERRETLTHELIHAHNLLIAEYARIEIERLLPSDEVPKYRAAILEGLRIRVEQSTCDLTHCINSRIK
jgi:hypothetical protein